MTDSHDDSLSEAFDSLRRDNQASAPSFSSLTAPDALGAQRWRHRRRRIVIAAAVILPVAFLLRPRTTSEPDFERFAALTGIDPGQVTWRAPSDFLLELPGRELLRTVPLIEVTVPFIPADIAGPPDSTPNKRRRTDS